MTKKQILELYIRLYDGLERNGFNEAGIEYIWQKDGCKLCIDQHNDISMGDCAVELYSVCVNLKYERCFDIVNMWGKDKIKGWVNV